MGDLHPGPPSILFKTPETVPGDDGLLLSQAGSTNTKIESKLQSSGTEILDGHLHSEEISIFIRFSSCQPSA
ncbi:hypothetical protein CBS63078_138 [Aspergillus niger]|nr:hypothetical protein CBS115989_988 [Aspergillus niger]KAI2826734.1 hypothetical protein CBS133816_7239 [Aspergillus niger]KAI2835566.1 hypothetical protein CBS11350_9947 [Aspergillus niger]KAI2851584.1 hypothetical protein CBS11232_5924 [Aspergillus niger]KAI2863066.1 hypothetical protein CBS12448_4279 [Aspergillus niger]